MRLQTTGRLATRGRASFDFFDRVIRTFVNIEASSAASANVSSQNQYPFHQEYERFKIWAVDIGLLAPGHGSLDYRLRDTESLGATVESFLTDLNQYLGETLEFSKTDAPRAESLEPAVPSPRDEESDSFDGDSISETGVGDEFEPQWYLDILLASIVDVIDQLYKLSTLIRNPATRLISSKADKYRNVDVDSGTDIIDAFSHSDHDYVLSVVRHYHSQLPGELSDRPSIPNGINQDSRQLWHQPEACTICKSNHIPTDHVDSINEEEDEKSTRWAEAEESVDFLIHRLARAINQRRRHFAYWKHHRDKLESYTEKTVARNSMATMPPDIVPVALGDGNRMGPVINPLRLSELLAPPTVTTATALGQIPLLPMDNRSEISVSEYAASDWDPAREILQFPEPPKVQRNDKFFVCPYCYIICPRKMASEKAWKAHLIHDLRPYICTYPLCHTANQLYDRRQDWAEHENTIHRRQWRCPEHVDRLYDSRDQFLNHITSEHQEDLDVMCSESYLRSCEAVSPIPDRPCPVCFFVATDTTAMQSHVARHLERFALFSLPRSTDDDKEDDSAGSADAVDAMQSSRDLSSGSLSESEGDLDDLAAAARAGDLRRVEDILEESSVSGDDRGMALIEACARGHETIARSLLNHGADVNYVYNDTDLGSTPLISACSSGHTGITRLLINLGANVDAKVDHYADGSTALIAACAGRNLEIVKILISHGADINLVARSQTALSVAAREGQRVILLLLLDNGATINPLSEDEPSALREAAAEGHEDIVKNLLRLGAHPNPKHGRPALEPAALRGHESIVDTLIAAGGDVNWGQQANSTILGTTASFGHINVVQKLLAAGADPNARGSDRLSPLHDAAAGGHAEVAEILLKAGADPNVVDLINETPLHKACVGGHEDVALVLIHGGINLNISSRKSGTALQLAVKSGKKEIADALLAAGADPVPTEYHMDDLVRFHEQSDTNSSDLPDLPRIWNIQPTLPENEGVSLTLEHEIPHSAVIACVAFSADGKYLALGSRAAVKIYDVQDNQDMVARTELEHTSGNEDHFVRSLSFSPDGKFLVTGGEDGIVRLWDIDTAQVVHSFDALQDIYAVAFSLDGRCFASGGANGRIDIFDIVKGDIVRDVSRDHGNTSLAFSPDGQFLAAGALDGEIILISLNGHATHPFSRRDGHKDSILSLAFAPDGSRLYSASLDKTVKSWRVEFHSEGFGTYTETMTGHEDYVLSVAITGDSKWLVSGSRDKTIRLWNCETGELEAIVKGHKNSVISVATCPTRKLIATASGDKTATVWSYD